MRPYYNEIDKNAVAWLRALMRKGLIPDGDIDTRSIRDVRPDDLRGYDQWHFFAGIGIWAYALRQAGWPDDVPVASASAPCQPWSVAGKQRGADDDRHLWPDFFRLARAMRWPYLMGEQVARKAGEAWLDGVRSDLESENYRCGAVVVPACAVDAPHIRSRTYWVAHLAQSGSGSFWDNGYKSSFGEASALCEETGKQWIRANVGPNANVTSAMVDSQVERRRQGRTKPGVRCGRHAATGPDASIDMVNAADPYSWWRFLSGSGSSSANRERPSGEPTGSDGGMGGARGWNSVGHADGERLQERQSIVGDTRPQLATAGRTDDRAIGFWNDHEWIVCHDGKKRRAKSGLPLLVDGFRGRIPLWRGLGNAIVAPLAIEVIKAFLESEDFHG